MFDSAFAMRRLRADRKAAGVCIYCAEPLVTETMCGRHAEMARRGSGPLAMRAKKRYPLFRKSKRGNPREGNRDGSSIDTEGSAGTGCY